MNHSKRKLRTWMISNRAKVQLLPRAQTAPKRVLTPEEDCGEAMCPLWWCKRVKWMEPLPISILLKKVRIIAPPIAITVPTILHFPATVLKFNFSKLPTNLNAQILEMPKNKYQNISNPPIAHTYTTSR